LKGTINGDSRDGFIAVYPAVRSKLFVFARVQSIEVCLRLDLQSGGRGLRQYVGQAAKARRIRVAQQYEHRHPHQEYRYTQREQANQTGIGICSFKIMRTRYVVQRAGPCAGK
jgi:hypothetical protein